MVGKTLSHYETLEPLGKGGMGEVYRARDIWCCLLIAVCTTWLASGSLSAAQARAEETLVFILAGQSNMVGQGNTAELSEELRRLPRHVVYYLNGEQTSIADHDRFGPEVTFAHELSRAYPQETIVLIKFAVGGSSLLAWAPDWTAESAQLTADQGQGPLYERLMDYISVSISRHQQNARLAGVLWMQGERDARFPAAGREYGANLSALVQQLRGDLDTPDLPFIFGQVNPPPERYPASEEVRNAQQAAEGLIVDAIMISTEGLAKHDDNLHYNTEGQLELGRRFARAYIELQGRQWQGVRALVGGTPARFPLQEAERSGLALATRDNLTNAWTLGGGFKKGGSPCPMSGSCDTHRHSCGGARSRASISPGTWSCNSCSTLAVPTRR